MKQDISVVGIDIAKRIFHLVGMDAQGQVILRKCLARGEVLSFMANRAGNSFLEVSKNGWWAGIIG